MAAHADTPMVVRSARPGGVLRTNRAFDELVGFSPDDLAEREFTEWMHEEDRDRLEPLLAAGEGRLDARHETRDGAYVTLTWHVRTTDGERVVLGRPQSEQAAPGLPDDTRRRQASPRLGDTLQTMARIVEAKNPGLRCSILLLNASGDRVSVGAGPSLPPEYNAAVEGLRVGPAVGSCGTAAFWDTPVVVEDIAADPLWRDLRDDASLAGVGACWSVPIRAVDGGVLGAMALYADEARTPTSSQMSGLEIASHMVGFAIERDMLEQQLRDAEKMEAIGQLAAGVAHNFNNLLTVILGHVQLMSEEPDTAPDKATLDAIGRAVASASEITSELLALGGRSTPEGVRADLDEALHELTRVLDPLLGDDVTVAIESDPSIRWITVDRSHLGQIMLNLLLNARDAMPGGGRVLVRARRPTSHEVMAVNAELPASRYVAVSVTDDGVGMDSETRERVFEPFFTTKVGQGNGLGLATVYSLTTKNGGHVTIASEEGEGTTVTLFFPDGGSAAVAPTTADEARETIASALVAEDNDEIRHLIVRVLSGAGFDVSEARNGADAWALVEGGREVDLLVTDVMMARMGGVELAERVRAHSPDTRILFVSGHAFDRLSLPELDEAREAFLAKPFSPSQLRDAARHMLALAPTGVERPGGA